MCPPFGERWQAEAAGVMEVLTAEGTQLYSGSMINSIAGDGRQLMLTAAHCDGGPVGASDDWIVLFNFVSPTCEDGPAAPSRNSTAQGTKLLARRGKLHRHPSDFALLEVVESIPDDYRVFLNGECGHSPF